MHGASRIKPSALGLWSVVGTLLLLSAMPPARAANRQGVPHLEAGWSAEPCVTMTTVEAPSLSAPPAGAGSFRPTHFSVAAIIVAVERVRIVALSRIGGLHGP